MTSLEEVKKLLSYEFKDENLLKVALTHRSYLNENSDCIESNERLEFLGDALLGMIVGEFLYRMHGQAQEGELSKRKSELIDRHACSSYIERLGVLRFLYTGKGVEKKISMGADLFEALLGAIYLDSDYTTVVKFFFDHFSEDMHNGACKEDPKTRLQIYLQKNGGDLPEYRVEKTSGKEHSREYHVAVYHREQKIGFGVGSSIKEAEKAAAKDAL